MFLVLARNLDQLVQSFACLLVLFTQNGHLTLDQRHRATMFVRYFQVGKQ